ncbi:hypothetical protein Aspvir_003323 [Aspergillus viridinutans]|uniref:ABC transporter domain-containing protein n=1 Tax=Aspergillus viridinutans TaxID=75553 RepID=A0A9P3C4X9_ASPVI|nr:uncharacterized protein Aspvir_003323 [Aspergillus viridinutans]GIK07657.1 hypothetical protein Aspvir_003323 [Aspergillus viridinutans]
MSRSMWQDGTPSLLLCFMQMFRAVGALCKRFGNASKITGLLSTIFFVYGDVTSGVGNLIPYEKMHVWFRWIFYLNPGAYAFEALMANEFVCKSLQCVQPDYIPYGAGYPGSESPYRGCSIPGSQGDMILGAQYIRAQYNYSWHHIWRSFGVIVGFWIFFIVLTAMGLELLNSQGGSSVLLYKRGRKSEETPTPVQEGALASHVKQSTFTWHNLDYHVPYQGEKKQLLDKVFGFVKPGNLVALMGCSGAGKTTLLDVLAQRKDSGEIYGSILIDGRPQGISFQRTTGYCEQMDVHEATATVREALVFSVVLRQPAHVPREEKLAYVDHIIDLLELRDIGDALIGVPGAGLSIEQRKRVTLGVELVAKPTLLFLDEPTSGLDGQSAYNIIRLLRKLFDGGQAMLCTIHQPSAVLFEAFDSLLLLARGGKMAYFGETGKDSQIVLDYFARHGAPCPPDENLAEHIVEVIQGNTDKPIDWVQVWNESEQKQSALAQLQDLNARGKADANYVEDTADYATSKWFQFTMVTKRLGSKIYHSLAFIGAQTVSEIPYLILCATLYFACWYFTAGFPATASISGHMYLQMIIYEFLYTSIGQVIAAYAPNEYFAAVMNPVLIGAGLVSFCGVVVPYSQMQPFWRYWLYYLDPFTYLVGGLLGEVLWDVKVRCEPSELVRFSAPVGQTCGEYMAAFLAEKPGYLLMGMRRRERYYSWRDTGITALFCISSYAMVFLMMKLRSKKTKSARSE